MREKKREKAEGEGKKREKAEASGAENQVHAMGGQDETEGKTVEGEVSRMDHISGGRGKVALTLSHCWFH